MKLIGILLAILIFSLIIISHEAGHMLVAKRNGINVIEFSIGFGPNLFSKKWGGTIYSIKLLPFGGACMMQGMDGEEDPDHPEPGSYFSATVWQRMAAIFAGPFANIIVAFVLSLILTSCAGIDPARVVQVADQSAASEAGLLPGDIITSIDGQHVGLGRDIYTYLNMTPITGKAIKVSYIREGKKYNTTLKPTQVERYLLGFSYVPTDTSETKGGCVITEISQGFPMAAAGIKSGDVITSINGHKVASSKELKEYMNEHPATAEPMEVTYLHGDKELKATITPKHNVSYSIDFSYNLGREKQSIGGVLKGAWEEVRYWVVVTVKSLGMLFTGRLSANDLGGAVAIVDMIGDSYTETVDAGGNAADVTLQLMYIAILLSADLFVMNLLPLPILDGGRLLQLIVEAITRKPLNRKVETVINFVGVVFLFMLMIFVFFNDIRRIVMGG